MKQVIICCTWMVLLVPVLVTHAQTGDRAHIIQTIEEAYIQGVFKDRSESAVRAGFHPSFTMAVYDDDALIQASLDMWLERMNLDGVASSDSVRAEFEQIDITDQTASVKLQLWINGEHVYSDYLGLYKFSDGWKIVNKLFASHAN